MFVYVQQRLGHGDVEELSASRSFPLEECGENSGCSLHAGVHVAMTEGVVGVVAIADITLVFGKTCFCIHHGGIGASIHPGTSCPVATDGGIDEARVSFRQLVVAQSKAGHDTWTKVLDDDVADIHQLTSDLHGPCTGKVQRHVQLADVLLDEIGGE